MSIEIPINVNMEVEESQMAFDMKVDEDINVIVIQGTDVPDTTAVESDVLEGKKFHKADGSLATGTFSIPVQTNMITNGDFSQSGATTDGWASIRPNYASIAISGGKLVLTHTATSNGAFGVRLSDINTTAGHTYYFRYKFTKTMNDSDADSKVIDIKLGSDVATCIRGLTQNDVVENVAAYVAQSNNTTLDIDFGGNIATTASNESMLELWYIEMYDITDIVAGW